MTTPHTRRAQVLSRLINDIVVERDWPRVPDLVATFNALVLPRAYLYVDPDNQLHLVIIDCSIAGESIDQDKPPLPTGVMHCADVVWRFHAQDGIWTTLKDRTGVFASLCPLQAGGMPSRRVPSTR